MPPDPPDAAAPIDPDAVTHPVRDAAGRDRPVSCEMPRAQPREGMVARLARALGDPTSPVAGARAEPTTGTQPGARAIGRGRVLVVDDSADLRAYVAELLSSLYEVEDAADGASALAAALERPPDLVLSDVAMPGLDGLSLVRALREHEATRTTCVVLVSAEGSDVAEQGLELGADDYIAKPFTARELLARVAAHVATARIRRECARREALAREEAARASRRAAEAEARLAAAGQLERRLALLSDALRGSTWELDVATRQVRWGRGLASLLGHASEDLADPGASWVEWIDPEDRERVVASLDAALASDAASWRTEYRLRRRDGSIALLDVRGVIDRDAGGRALRVVGVALDVTEQRALEERLRTTQRTEAMGILAAGVAHEVNDMMTAVIGFGELALRRADSGAAPVGEVREMLRAARRASRVTQQLASFGARREPDEELDVEPVLRDLTSMLSRLLGADVALTLSVPPHPAYARLRRSELEQLVVDAVLAVRDAMPRGGRLTIRVRSARFDASDAVVRAAPGDYTVLEILGKTPLRVSRSALSPSRLAATHAIARQSGGFVEVPSDPARGPYLRLFLRGARSLATQAQGESAEPRTILVVEDEPLVRRLTKRILEHAGFRVLEAANGGDALELASEAQGSLGLVVSDLVMPRLGGRELGRRLHDRGIDIPILFMSAYSGDHIARYDLLEPDSPFLQKPFAADRLLREVQNVLARSRSKRPDPR